MSLTVLLGGTRSGKSDRAEALADRTAGEVVYVATGSASDPELAERVAAHRDRRPDGWTTRETVDVAAVLAEVTGTTTVLIDDLEGWLVDRMTSRQLWTDAEVAPLGEEGRRAHAAVVDEAAAWARTAAARRGRTIVVAGQTGWGPTPPSASTRRWLDLHGDVLRAILAVADDAELVVAGRALRLPPERSPAATAPSPAALRDHGDTQVPVGCIDLAVNVEPGPPRWLRDRLASAMEELSRYPDDGPARRAVAARHGRSPSECLVLNGAADGFWLLAQVLRPQRAVCVHPSFTEGERALHGAGVPVTRILRRPADDWRLDPADVPAEADLVVLGRPDNPTGIVDPEATIAALCRPGRTVVVDEAFAEFLPDADGLAARRDLPGLVVLRSLTKIWGLAGLRVGYLLAEPRLVARLADARQPWSVNALALTAVEACVGAEEERSRRAAEVASERAQLLARLAEIDRVRAWPAAANFVLLQTPLPDLRERLLTDGIAVRRGETFPGLDATFVRVAVRDSAVTDILVEALARHVAQEAHRAVP